MNIAQGRYYKGRGERVPVSLDLSPAVPEGETVTALAGYTVTVERTGVDVTADFVSLAPALEDGAVTLWLERATGDAQPAGNYVLHVDYQTSGGGDLDGKAKLRVVS